MAALRHRLSAEVARFSAAAEAMQLAAAQEQQASGSRPFVWLSCALLPGSSLWLVGLPARLVVDTSVQKSICACEAFMTGS